MFSKPSDLNDNVLNQQLYKTVNAGQMDMALSYAYEVIKRLNSRLDETVNEKEDLKRRVEKLEKSNAKQQPSQSKSKTSTNTTETQE